VHFIGVGGIGMSALAQWYVHEGWQVSGSDEADSPIVQMLRKKEVRITVGEHSAKHLPLRAERVIFSQAVVTRGKHTNPEVRAAKRRGITLLSYPQALGALTRDKYTIAICGTHGKSTTTGLVGALLTEAGLDPTVIVGATVSEFGNTNFRYGGSRYLVIEADEYKGSFLEYDPDIIIWTSIEWEHIDYFKTFAETRAHFRAFLSRIHPKGHIIANKDDTGIRAITKHIKRVVYYSFSQKRALKNIQKHIRLFGRHNVSNVLGVYELSKIIGIPSQVFYAVLRRFSGVGRRMEYKGVLHGALVYDDYGHHPTEVKATLNGVRARFEKRLRKGALWCVYQPHQYQRTKYLFRDFARAFTDADCVLLVDVYSVAGREKASMKKGVGSKQLAEAVIRKKTPAIYTPVIKDAAHLLGKAVRKHDVVVVMGAGDIWKIWGYLKL